MRRAIIFVADIKVQRMDRDVRGKVWKPYETTGREKGKEMQDSKKRKERKGLKNRGRGGS